jgi:DNA-binding NarL/FixJ family response regulator
MTEPVAEPITVVVADDQRAIREALAMVLDNESDIVVVGQAADGDEAVTLAAERGAQVVLMDLRMPGSDGVEATRRLSDRHPEIKVVVLTTYADDESISEALAAGAIGYLTKDAGHRQIGLAVRSAAAGQTVLDPAVHSALLRRTMEPSRPSPAPDVPMEPPDNLTAREVEVLRGIAGGKTNGEIAAELYISEVTVKSHVNHLFSKIGSRSRAEAVRYAYDHNLTGDDRSQRRADEKR